MKISILKLIISILAFCTFIIPNTSSSYVDRESSANNYIQAATWDTSPPIISNISNLVGTPNNPNDTTATVTWSTNENATSNLEYGMVSGVYTALAEDLTLDTTSHTREITGLMTDTTYYYIVKSKDAAGNETISSEQTFSTSQMRPGDPSITHDVVINEFLPNPAGDDDATMPAGEWIELYNNSLTDTYDLTGWYLTDSDSSHRLDITLSNATSFSIAPGQFVVVYRNGDTDFSLNDDAAGDQLNLYDGAHNLIDQQNYNSGLGDAILENKSFARYPDGSEFWFDPIPTPGGPNKLEEFQSTEPLSSLPDPIPIHNSSPTAEISFVNEKKVAFFKINNIQDYSTLSYELTYTAYDVAKGVIGNGIDILNLDTYEKEIDLATCSSGICTYDQNIREVKLKVTLINAEGIETAIEQNL